EVQILSARPRKRRSQPYWPSARPTLHQMVSNRVSNDHRRMTMTTTTTSRPDVPAWLNLDALGLPDEGIAALRALNGRVRELGQELGRLLARAAVVDRQLEGCTYGTGGVPDGVAEVSFAHAGRRELWDLLGLMQGMGEAITPCSGPGDRAL